LLAHAAGRADARHVGFGGTAEAHGVTGSSPAVGLGYVALFGIGSMIGMGALSTVITMPRSKTNPIVKSSPVSH
jgi:hypothetical protein